MFTGNLCAPSKVPMSKCILIADDNPGVRLLIRTFLRIQTKYDVCGEAVDGVDAIEQSKKLKPDLVLLDLLMPRMNGAEAASVIKSAMPHVPIVLFSIFGDQVGKSLTSAVGIDAVISKPDGMTQLIQCVEKLLAA
jgi:two-component system, NarL family, response regulator LiaR